MILQIKLYMKNKSLKRLKQYKIHVKSHQNDSLKNLIFLKRFSFNTQIYKSLTSIPLTVFSIIYIINLERMLLI